MKNILVVSVLVLLGLSTAIAAAHSGGTNKQGCHKNNKTGDYHCH